MQPMEGPPPYQQPPYQPIPQYQPQMPRPMRHINWIVVFGGLIILIGIVMVAVSNFSYATVSNTATFDDIRWTYQLAGAGEVIEGVGLLLAFLGLALGRPVY